MNGTPTGGEPDVRDARAVGCDVAVAITGAEHVAVLPHRRADVGLAELDERVRLDGEDGLPDVLHQSVGRLGERLDVASGVVLLHGGVCADEMDVVDEVELEAVDPPLAHRLGEMEGDELPHLREARIERPSAHRVGIRDEHPLETLVVL